MMREELKIARGSKSQAEQNQENEELKVFGTISLKVPLDYFMAH